MKCEICGDEIIVVYEYSFPTDEHGRSQRGSEWHLIGPRCGCYDCEGHPDCDYHYLDEGIVKRNDPPPPGPFDDFISILSLDDIFNTPPLIDSLRGKG